MTTLVLGVGVSGLAAARLAHSFGHVVRFFDERTDATLPDDLVSDPLIAGPWNRDTLQGVDLVVTSPGFPPTSAPLVQAIELGIPIATEVGFALDHIDAPYLAVTGTNGKTTVTEMATDMLVGSGIDAKSIGNIGTPASTVVDEVHDAYVVELSSFQLHWWTPRPRAAALVNVAPDHLDWHGDMAAYTADKAKVFAGLADDGLVAYDADDDGASAVVAAADVASVPCSGSTLPELGNGVVGDALVIGGVRFRCPDHDVTRRANLVIAATIASELGATEEGIGSTIAGFEPGANRRHVVRVVQGVTWVNDSKATNPHATVAACKAFPRIRLLAGGKNKNLDLTAIGSIEGVLHIYCFGESGDQIAANATRPASVYRSMLDAVAAAQRDAIAGDTVLLSPGCTSFDEFTSYAERGRVFEDAVHAMDGGDVR